MDIAVVLNLLKWQIHGRLPKEEFFVRAFQRPENNYSEDDLLYYLYLCDLYDLNILKYLFGSYLIDEQQIDNFYNFLERYKKDDYYQFEIEGNLLRLPIPFENDRRFFRNELFDLVLPYLAGYPENKKVPFHEGPYEYNNVFLREQDIVLDLGANVGMFSAFASSKNCYVYAFEPTMQTIEKYLRTTALLNPNIQIVNKAASNKSSEQVLFSLDTDNSACNGFTEINGNAFNHDEVLTTVETTTIDDFVCEQNLGTVDFIKADIEGAERLMLEGAQETLKEFAPDLAICYYHCLDDYRVLKELILSANPEYEIEKRYKKIYAHSKVKSL